jgi:hypothetical protein
MKPPTRSATEQSRALGEQLVLALADRDAARLRGLFGTPVTFRAVTPRRFWDADTPVGVADVFLGPWFGEDVVVTDVVALETDRVGDVHKVSYRLAVQHAGSPAVIEQVAYYSAVEGRITDLRLVCSGFRRPR